MYRKLFSAFIFAAMVFSVSAQDYCFPASSPPAGKSPDDVQQYVTFIFDDNAYSGKEGTTYEYKTGVIPWADRATVGGVDGTQNPFNITETSNALGICWAVNEFAGKKRSGGRAIHFTFNVITGIFIPAWGPDWTDRQSKLGSFKDPVMSPDHTNIPRTWGREYMIGTSQGSSDVQESFSIGGFNDVKSGGHEIGNHTIDHMESNSPLPNDSKGFGKWGSEGFDTEIMDALPDGRVINEQEMFGVPDGAWQLTNGWWVYAGQVISKEAWKGAIELGEAQLSEYISLSTLYAFRAPRLEIDGNCLLALKELDYEYLCGLEEGFEEHRDGTNMLWPYTTDNGIQNDWFQREMGEPCYLDQTPAGLWTVPVNTFIVPDDIRGDIWENYNKIASADPVDPYIIPKADFIQEGKVTGFDFNMFILWGFTCDQALKTLKHTLDLRLEGNKAPLQIGCHTDYFTPIYDYATLMSDFNAGKYGLVISNNWNDWEGRKQVFVDFLAYCQQKGCQVISGHELIEEMRNLCDQEVFGNEIVDYSTVAQWIFFKELNSTATQEIFDGNIDNVTVSVDCNNGNADFCGFEAYEDEGYFSELDHIEFTYQTTSALMLQIVLSNDKPWEVLLNNKGSEVQSGRIPLSAFEYNRFNVGDKPDINTNKIIGLTIRPLTSGEKQEDVTFSVKDFKLYIGEGITNKKLSNSIADIKSITMNSINKNMLRLNIGDAGKYTINIFSANGRIVKLFNDISLSKGVNSLKLNNLSSGVYMIKINKSNSANVKKTIKAMVL